MATLRDVAIQQQQIENLLAGGPGSGRHKGAGGIVNKDVHNVLMNHFGFNSPRLTNGKSRYTNGDHAITVSPNGDWYHSHRQGSARGRGNGTEELSQHLSKYKNTGRL